MHSGHKSKIARFFRQMFGIAPQTIIKMNMPDVRINADELLSKYALKEGEIGAPPKLYIKKGVLRVEPIRKQ